MTSTGSPVSSAKVVGDAPLQRVVGLEVGRGVPAVDHAGGEHRGVLARAVHQHRRLRAAGADHLPPARRRRAGSPAGVCRSASSRPADAEDPAYALDVERLTGVRGAGQREQVGRQVEPEPAPCPAPGPACCTSAAAPAPSTSPTDHATVPSAVERDHRAVVVALDEPVADDLGDDTGRQGSSWQASGQGSDAGRMCPVPDAPALPDAAGAGRPRAAHRRGAGARSRGSTSPARRSRSTCPADARPARRGRAGRPRGPAAGPGLAPDGAVERAHARPARPVPPAPPDARAGRASRTPARTFVPGRRRPRPRTRSPGCAALGGPVVLLALTGPGTPELSPVGAAPRHPGRRRAGCRTPPWSPCRWPSHGDAEADHALGVQVVAAYAGARPGARRCRATADGDYPDDIAAIVDADRPAARPAGAGAVLHRPVRAAASRRSPRR